MTEQILKNFTRKELSCRCCGAFNCDNDFLTALQKLRDKLGKPITVNCSCRCKKHNAEVGGVPTSLHECSTKKASAADLTSGNVEELFKAACNSGLFNEIILYKSQKFVHCGIDPKQKADYHCIKS